MLDGRASSRGFSVGLAALIEDLDPAPTRHDRVGSVSDLARAARLRQELALRQARAGQLENACASAEGAVRLYRRLACAEPARYQPELALTLTAWGLWSSRLGEPARAVRSLSDAVALNRILLNRSSWLRPMRRVRLRVALAVSLSNLSDAHAQLGELTAATDAAEEAVARLRRLRTDSRLYRMLSRGDPLGFDHCLASALNNLAVVLADRGRRLPAWELAVETTDIYRELARVAPVMFESELARALHNLGLAAVEIGHSEIALAATHEAVVLQRSLVRTESFEYRHHLGRALCSFARVRACIGDDLDEALHAAEEATRIHEELTRSRPTAFSGDLHTAYRTVSDVERALGRPSVPRPRPES